MECILIVLCLEMTLTYFALGLMVTFLGRASHLGLPVRVRKIRKRKTNTLAADYEI